jgi:hypothetical protein
MINKVLIELTICMSLMIGGYSPVYQMYAHGSEIGDIEEPLPLDYHINIITPEHTTMLKISKIVHSPEFDIIEDVLLFAVGIFLIFAVIFETKKRSDARRDEED